MVPGTEFSLFSSAPRVTIDQSHAYSAFITTTIAANAVATNPLVLSMPAALSLSSPPPLEAVSLAGTRVRVVTCPVWQNESKGGQSVTVYVVVMALVGLEPPAVRVAWTMNVSN